MTHRILQNNLPLVQNILSSLNSPDINTEFDPYEEDEIRNNIEKRSLKPKTNENEKIKKYSVLCNNLKNKLQKKKLHS